MSIIRSLVSLPEAWFSGVRFIPAQPECCQAQACGIKDHRCQAALTLFSNTAIKLLPSGLFRKKERPPSVLLLQHPPAVKVLMLSSYFPGSLELTQWNKCDSHMSLIVFLASLPTSLNLPDSTMLQTAFLCDTFLPSKVWFIALVLS